MITVPRGSKENLEASLDVQGVIKAPFDKGSKLGSLKVMDGEKVVAEVALVALKVGEEAGFFKGLWDAIMLFFTELFSGDTLSV